MNGRETAAPVQSTSLLPSCVWGVLKVAMKMETWGVGQKRTCKQPERRGREREKEGENIRAFVSFPRP